MDKLQLNDASLTYELETSQALGFGFRCGFLGLLHMEIIQERLEREFNQTVITTVPNVSFHAFTTRGEKIIVNNPAEMPDATKIDHIDEPLYSCADHFNAGIYRQYHDFMFRQTRHSYQSIIT